MKQQKFLMGGIALLTTGLLLSSVYGATTHKVEDTKAIDHKEQVKQEVTSKEGITKEGITKDVLEDYEVYGIGSVSKMFGAVALMQLVQEGKVNLDTPLTDYIPEFEMADERYKVITPRMLLNHTSGILGGSHHDAMLLGDRNEVYTKQVLANLKTQRLKADPGAFSVYCNDGFTLVEILVERVSGMSFTEFVTKNISEPLGMENTYTSMETFDQDLLAKTYYAGMETPYEAVAPLASGGIYSTAEDLCKFSKIFMEEETLLKQPYKDEMAKAWYMEDKIGVQEGDSMFGYGLGWDTVNSYPFNQYGIKALAKGGDTTVYHSNLTVLPEENISIAVVSSGGSSVHCQLAVQEILLEVLKEEGIIDEIKEEKAFTKPEKVAIPESMKHYAGFYQAKHMLEVSFTDEDTMVLKEFDGKYPSAQEYIYTADGRFASVGGKYISSTGMLASAENGTKGITYLNFREEQNGKIYLLSSSYESVSGLGKAAYTIPIAEKIAANVLDDNVIKAWQQRDGKKYYLVSERYSGSYNLSLPYLEIGLLGQVPGYTKSTESVMNTRIIDENLSRSEVQIPGVIGRDLKDYHFYTENGAEYLRCVDLLFISEDAVETTKELTGKIKLNDAGYTKWYQVTQEDAGREIEIQVPEKGAYYIYNEDGECITSSILKENSATIIFPKKGSISLVGNPGALFSVKEVTK